LSAEIDRPEQPVDLTAIFDHAFVGICFARDGLIARCNQRTADIFGFPTAEDLVGRPATILYTDRASYDRLNHDAAPPMSRGESFAADWLMRRADGREVWCRLYGKAIEPSRLEKGTVWVVEDITEQKQAVEALQESKAVLDDALEHMDQGISMVDTQLIGPVS
jgi:PAS domain S-box-containing protein